MLPLLNQRRLHFVLSNLRVPSWLPPLAEPWLLNIPFWRPLARYSQWSWAFRCEPATRRTVRFRICTNLIWEFELFGFLSPYGPGRGSWWVFLCSGRNGTWSNWLVIFRTLLRFDVHVWFLIVMVKNPQTSGFRGFWSALRHPGTQCHGLLALLVPLTLFCTLAHRDNNFRLISSPPYERANGQFWVLASSDGPFSLNRPSEDEFQRFFFRLALVRLNRSQISILIVFCV